MGYESEASVIEQYFNSNYSATPIRWENTPWDLGSVEEWLEFFIISGDSGNISIGNVSEGTIRRRFVGVVMGHIYVKEKTGTRRLRQLADVFASVFENQTVSGIQFRTPNIAQTQSPNVGFRRWVVTVPFERDET